MDAEIIRIVGTTILFVHSSLFIITDNIKYGVWAILGAILMNYQL